MPTASDGAALGTGTLMWSDLFLASGGVINFNNGNTTITHSAGSLTFAGGASANWIFNTGTTTFNSVSAGAIGTVVLNATTAGTPVGLGYQDALTSKWFLYKNSDNSFRIQDFAASSRDAMFFTTGTVLTGRALFGNPFGYQTALGVGGTVTQGTSRTTGVTLNAASGAITLFSAAGSGTAASFTVTNSTVAATDTIIVNQKSGTDKYDLGVTAVGAGSFEITFRTYAGTTTEQPVFQFNVIKGTNN